MQSRLKELQGEFAEEQAKKRNLELQLDTARANVLSLEALREVSCPWNIYVDIFRLVNGNQVRFSVTLSVIQGVLTIQEILICPIPPPPFLNFKFSSIKNLKYNPAMTGISSLLTASSFVIC